MNRFPALKASQESYIFVQAHVNVGIIFKNKLWQETPRRSTAVSASAQTADEDDERSIPGGLGPQMNNEGFAPESIWIIRFREDILNQSAHNPCVLCLP